MDSHLYLIKLHEFLHCSVFIFKVKKTNGLKRLVKVEAVVIIQKIYVQRLNFVCRIS